MALEAPQKDWHGQLSSLVLPQLVMHDNFCDVLTGYEIETVYIDEFCENSWVQEVCREAIENSVEVRFLMFTK
jgi:hypothetical protein